MTQLIVNWELCLLVPGRVGGGSGPGSGGRLRSDAGDVNADVDRQIDSGGADADTGERRRSGRRHVASGRLLRLDETGRRADGRKLGQLRRRTDVTAGMMQVVSRVVRVVVVAAAVRRQMLVIVTLPSASSSAGRRTAEIHIFTEKLKIIL